MTTKSKTSTTSIPTVTVNRCIESDRVGGRHFDLDMANQMLKIATTKLKADITESPRALQRLLKQSNQAKLILSTNKQVEFFVEGLINDMDFRSSLQRKDFEDLIAPRIALLPKLINKTLEISNMTLSNLSGVEVVGGGWRVPKVQQLLEETVKPLDLGQHVNGDESFAMGSVLMAANSSSLFRLKPLQFTDALSFTYSVNIRNATSDVGKTRELVGLGSRFHGVKTITMKGCDDVMAELVEISINTGDITSLARYNISGVREACENEYKEFGIAKIALVFNLSPVGVVSLDKAMAVWEETYLGPAPPTTTTTTKPTTTTTTTTTTSDGPSTESTTTTTPATTTTTTTSTTTSTTSEEPQMIEKIRKHTVKCQVTTEESVPFTMDDDSIALAATKLSDFIKKDEEAVRLAKAQNDIEALIYATRSRVGEEGDLVPVTEPQFRKDLLVKLEMDEDWLLYGEGISATLEDLRKRLDALHKLIVPASSRASELKSRGLLTEKVNAFKVKVEERYTSLLTDETVEFDKKGGEEFKKRWDEFVTSFSKDQETQATKKLTEEPAYKAETVFRSLLELAQKYDSFLKSIKLISKPLIEANSTDTSQANTNATTTDDDDDGIDITKKMSNNNTTAVDDDGETKLPADAAEKDDDDTPTPAPRRKDFSKTNDEL